MSGLFIAFEGLDGAGKTTQLNLAAEWLRKQGFPVVTTTDPAGTEYGRQLYEAMGQCHPCDAAKLLSFAAARAELVSQVVLPAIAARNVVLCDRWIPSTIAYQGFGSRESISAIRQANAIALKGLALPTKVIWLDLPPTESLSRAQSRGADLFEQRYSIDFLSRVFGGYDAQCAANPGDWVRINATATQAAVSKRIESALAEFLEVGAFLQFA